MAEYNYIQWMKEGQKRFGKDLMKWRFVCPACGHIQTPQEIKDAGGDPETQGCYCCVGRFTGKGEPKKGDGSGCNWTAGGLFGTLGKGDTVITPDGNRHDIFRFADPEKGE